MLNYLLTLCLLSLIALVILFGKPKFGRKQIAAVLVSVLALAILFAANFQLNNMDVSINDFETRQKNQSVIKAYLDDQNNIEGIKELSPLEFFTGIKRYLQQEPLDSETWILLGNLLQGIENNRFSLQAYKKAYEVSAGDIDYALAYVNARLSLLSNLGALDNENVEVLESILRKHPGHQKTLMLLGATGYQGEDFELAQRAWGDLLATLQTRGDSVPKDVIEALEKSIDKAASKARGDSEPEAELEAVNIKLAIQFGRGAQQALLSADKSKARLFIFIRAPGQRGMPLAAKNLALPQDLTSTLELSIGQNDVLMGANLAGMAELELSGRLSISGDAIPAAGDWRAQALVIPQGHFDSIYKLHLDQVIDP